MADKTPLINGKSYDWGQIVLNVLGRPVVGVTAINYDDEQDIVDNYGAGRFPVSRGYGNITTTGSITLTADELEALADIAPNRRLQNISPFDITVSYLNEGKTVTHKLRNVNFMNNGRASSQGDTTSEKEITLKISNIDW